jgi:hypothetical protein
MEATFDPSGKPAGNYKLEIIDTQPEQIGHVSSGLSTDTFALTQAAPQVTDVTVNSSGVHYGYSNLGNPWRLRFSGSDFNMSGSPPVEVYLASAIVDGQPAGNNVAGTVVQVTGNNNIQADVDLSGLPAGFYYGWVKNLNNNLTGSTASAVFEVRILSASLTGFAPNTGYNFFENYYDIPSTIAGTGLATANQVKITDGTTTYDITSESTLGGDVSIPVNLNLIAVDHVGSWKVQVYFPGGSFVERSFAVSLGKAIILPADNTKYAIRIHARRVLADQWNNETVAQRAWAWKNALLNNAFATFEVKGKGFPMNGSNTRLRIWKGSWQKTGNYAVSMDRAAKIVKITSAEWQMTNTTGDCSISVNAVIGDTTVTSYTNRWYLAN